jgi:rod shape-determining protein MreC
LKKRHLLLALGLVMVIAGLLALPKERSIKLKEKARDYASPIYRFTDWVGSFYRNVDTGLQTLEAAQVEAKRLKAANAELETRNSLLQDLSKENDRLREMLEFKKASQFKLLPCRVISRDHSSWWSVVTINRGWKDNQTLKESEGIVSDLPVVSPRGLVGKTGGVSYETTEVILMVDENCKIAATVENSGSQGIVVGEGTLDSGKPKARMRFIPKNAEMAVGERVFTSGLGGIFPPGLMIGTVAELPPLSGSRSFGLYREAIIDPVVDLSQLDELFLVVGARGKP